MEFRPYVYFYGRCEEALQFYKTALGGSYEATMVVGSFAESHMPEDQRNGVLHATFTSGAITFFASDGRQRRALVVDEGNMALAISAGDAAEGKRLFTALADGGTIGMAYESAPWGGMFGEVYDRFGISWMITAP